MPRPLSDDCALSGNQADAELLMRVPVEAVRRFRFHRFDASQRRAQHPELVFRHCLPAAPIVGHSASRREMTQLLQPGGLEELVEQLIVFEPSRIGGKHAITIKEGLHQRLAEIIGDAAAGERDILIAVGDTETAAIDITRKSLFGGDEIRQAGVAMGDDEILAAWPPAFEFGKQSLGTLSKPRLIEIGLVDDA